ncbi:BQ2448_2854 [Microbotryum intermedium]|uniref:BQ2448_2854 protein n=1 Tax=Microbotryum intermedium TaxID=269621 RepID=A0A238FJK9_9BASI|nr:BQ2448_2854 [Microbotryum intermedium]
MALGFPLGEHPDGDPFAAQDRERQANSRLGRTEARAQLEEQQRLKQEQAMQDRRNHVAAPASLGGARAPGAGAASSTASSNANTNGTGAAHPTAFTVAPPPPGRTHPRNSARLSSHNTTTSNNTNAKKRKPDLVISDTEDSSTTSTARSPRPTTPPEDTRGVQQTNILPARKRPRGENDQPTSVASQSGNPSVQMTQPTPVKMAPASDNTDEPMSDAPKRGDDSALLSTPAAPARRGRESSLSSIASSPHNGHTSPLPPGEEEEEEEEEEKDLEEDEEQDDNDEEDEDDDDDDGDDDDDDDDDEETADEDINVAAAVSRPRNVDGVPPSDENMTSPAKASTSAAKPDPAAVTEGSTNAVASTSSGIATNGSGDHDGKEDVKPTPPPPAMSAVRLTYSFPPRGSDHGVLQINIAEMAREAGYDPVKDNVAQVGSSDGEDDQSDGSDNAGALKQKREDEEAKPSEAVHVRLPIPGVVGPPVLKKRRRAPNTVLGRFGGYDVEDPFVDDSEINLYEPKFTAQPKRPGFYVCVGPVAILTKSHRGRIPGSKNKPRGSGGPEAGPDAGAAVPVTSTSALPTFGAIGQGAGGPPVRPPKKKASLRERGTFSPEMQKEIDQLKAEVAKESFEIKNKFPPRLRPILVDVAMRALELDEYDDDFFAIMPKIFPYNLFTMKKLIKREVFPKRIAACEAEQDRQIEIIRQNVVELLPISKKNHAEDYAAYRAARAAWEEKERRRLEGGGGTPEPSPGGFPSIAGVAAATGSDDEDASGLGLATTGPREPIYKFRFNEAMRIALYNACEIGDRMSELIIEKQELEKAVEQGHKVHSSANDRKILYAKLLKFWPTGDMTSNQLSREMSAAKNKLIRQSQR